jgi:prophage antirepressor-like protein
MPKITSAGPSNQYEVQPLRDDMKSSSVVIPLTTSTFVITSVQLRHFMDEHNEPWFIAKDVCEYLEISNISDACSRLFDGYVRIATVDMEAGQRDVNVVNELGLYQLIFQSRKPEAKVFQRSVYEMLRQLRREGHYTLPGHHGSGRYMVHGRQPFLDVIKKRGISVRQAYEAMNALKLPDVPEVKPSAAGAQMQGKVRVNEALARRASSWLNMPVEELFTESSRSKLSR